MNSGHRPCDGVREHPRKVNDPVKSDENRMIQVNEKVSARVNGVGAS